MTEPEYYTDCTGEQFMWENGVLTALHDECTAPMTYQEWIEFMARDERESVNCVEDQ